MLFRMHSMHTGSPCIELLNREFMLHNRSAVQQNMPPNPARCSCEISVDARRPVAVSLPPLGLFSIVNPGRGSSRYARITDNAHGQLQADLHIALPPDQIDITGWCCFKKINKTQPLRLRSCNLGRVSACVIAHSGEQSGLSQHFSNVPDVCFLAPCFTSSGSFSPFAEIATVAAASVCSPGSMASDTSDTEEFYDAAEDVNFTPSPHAWVLYSIYRNYILLLLRQLNVWCSLCDLEWSCTFQSCQHLPHCLFMFLLHRYSHVPFIMWIYKVIWLTQVNCLSRQHFFCTFESAEKFWNTATISLCDT